MPYRVRVRVRVRDRVRIKVGVRVRVTGCDEVVRHGVAEVRGGHVREVLVGAVGGRE